MFKRKIHFMSLKDFLKLPTHTDGNINNWKEKEQSRGKVTIIDGLDTNEEEF